MSRVVWDQIFFGLTLGEIGLWPALSSESSLPCIGWGSDGGVVRLRLSLAAMFLVTINSLILFGQNKLIWFSPWETKLNEGFVLGILLSSFPIKQPKACCPVPGSHSE